MSTVNTSSESINDALNLCSEIIQMLSVSQKEMHRRYRDIGNEWNDSKYQQLGDIVKECNSAIRKPLHESERCLVPLRDLEQSVLEYEVVKLYGGIAGNGVVSSEFTDTIYSSLAAGETHSSYNETTTFCATFNDGTVITLTNVNMETITYTKRDRGEWKKIRNEFDNKVKKVLLNELGQKYDSYLLDAGLSQESIVQIRSSTPSVPDGYEV